MKLTNSVLVLILNTYFVTNFIGGAQASALICFEIDGKIENYSFESTEVSFKKARDTLNLTSSDVFLDEGRVLTSNNERRKLVNTEECNKVINENQKATIAIQLSDNKQQKTITLQNDAKLDAVRVEVMKSLPEHYKNAKCADLYFVNKKGFEVLRADEAETQFQNILSADSTITLKNRFIQNRTEVAVKWLLETWQIQVNLRSSLGDLRYWITKPLNCPNLKEPLSLPDEPLFNTKNKADRTNWLVRDKHAALEDIPKYKNVDASASALTAPYNREEELAIESYVYTTQSTTNSKRIYYVDVLEAEETFLVGTQTNEFSDNHLKVTVISMDTDDKKILLLKNGRSTNQRSLVWENIVIASNNTRAEIQVEFINHQDDYLYLCELFEHRANYETHSLNRFVTKSKICSFDSVGSLKSASALIFNKETVIVNGEDISKYRNEISQQQQQQQGPWPTAMWC
ncbi:uncharacterized protein LOC6646290 isoform X1 [Drosophila willistoni]|uniref:uncharacterized protein LOC6646290 isoform X1 n=1 Tax=Drosophila willistoni TaxID=7260 RepID=UPI001F07813A|nr:uncharacterized protein LOC6646290 isoform X1 [Drosophila willistoni]